MKEHHILFCADMVRAYLAGKKTQTRRVIKLPRWSTETWSDFELDDEDCPVIVDYKTGCLSRIPCPYGKPSDTLWAKETWFYQGGNNVEPSPGFVSYRADGEFTHPGHKWTPSIFMPRWASRISFSVLNIRAERVQDISEADAEAEGVSGYKDYDDFSEEPDGSARWVSAREAYHVLWDRINTKRGYGWDNPTWPGWVWVIEFPKYEVRS